MAGAISSFGAAILTGTSLLCSCATHDSTGVPSAEATFNRSAGAGDWLFITLRLEDGQELLVLVDTGAPVSALDKSLERKLGKRLGQRQLHYVWKDAAAGEFKAPKLFLANTQLQTGSHVSTMDFSTDPARTNSTGRPLMGVLGMDCMRHYCIQLDFKARRMRFLAGRPPEPEALGRAFPLHVYPSGLSGYVTVGESFTATKRVKPILDTGCMADGILEPKEFEIALREQKMGLTRQFKHRLGFQQRVAYGCEATFGGETYTDLILAQAPPLVVGGQTNYLNAIGLPFLARHLVTLDFPRRTMFLRKGLSP
jgi:hypothetical protein